MSSVPKAGTTAAKAEAGAAQGKATAGNQAEDTSFKSTRDKTGVRPEPAPVAPAEKSRGNVFWPLVLGGVVAAGLGFAASEMDLLGFRAGDQDLRAALDSQAERIAQIENASAPEPTAGGEPADLSGIEGQLGDVSERLAALSASLEETDTRIAALEERPARTDDTGDDSEEAAAFAAELQEMRAAYAADLEEMKAAVEQQRGEIEGLLANAQSVEEATAAAARTASIQAGVSKLTAAINDGAAYVDVLAELEDAGVGDLPEPLVSNAADGVVTLSNLQTRYPDAARDALSGARAAGLDGEGGNSVGGFLRRQLGARSVQPRDGDDPDAVLSRAEGAVRDGRLSEALNEIDRLPGDVQSAMADWLSDARARVAAQTAVNDLSQRLTAN